MPSEKLENLKHRELAKSDYESIVDLAQRLIRIPTRGGMDPYEPILGVMHDWLSSRNLVPKRLQNFHGQTVALVCEVNCDLPGPRYVLNACLDTAPFGDESVWSAHPTSAAIIDGWLHGRGAADSKTGAAIFAHVAASLRSLTAELRSGVVLLFDVDEHTGNFGGAKAFFENEELRSGVEGVMIGYPGNDRVVIGGRGVFRFRIHVRGVSSHSGGSTATPNAISKAASLITKLSTVEFPAETGVFPRPPKLTVTLVEGGEGYSTTPDLCTINVDVRLTPDFPCKRALTLMQDLLGQLDTDWLETPKTQIEPVMYWPAYQLPDDCLVSSSLLAAARDCGLSPKAHVAGPSNIGNYLAGFDIPATAGFGVTYKGLHATDEQIELASIEPVYGTYLQALHCLLRR